MKIVDKLNDKLGKYGFVRFFYGAVLIGCLWWLATHGEALQATLTMFFAILPAGLIVILADAFGYSWMTYVRQKKYLNTDHVVLEIRIPEELNQTPYAMELVLRAIYQSGEIDTPIDRYFKGHTLPWFSLEIASTEGQVRFFVWTRKRYKNLIESQFYAHYPQVQVFEVPDYTLSAPYDEEAMDIWGIEQKLQKPDPYPILTYVEAGLDKRGEKEEFKHDPMSAILEFFGSMGKGEHAWMQIIFRAHNKNNKDYASYAHEETGEHMMIDKWAQHIIDEIGEKTKGKDDESINYTKLSEGEKDAIKAIQYKLNKQLYDVGIRMIYLSRKENTDSTKKAGFPSVMRSFEHGAEGRGITNGFKPIFVIGPFDYPWQDIFGTKKPAFKRELYEGYVLRQYFHSPIKHHHIVLNSEEIATVWHLPGKVAQTPTLQRMTSRRSGAPSNLPV